VEDLSATTLLRIVADLFALSETISGRFFTSRPTRETPEDLE
jgi:hypothetical protein